MAETSLVTLINSPVPSFQVFPHLAMKESTNDPIKPKKLTSLRNLVRNARKAMERRTDKATSKPKNDPICKASKTVAKSIDVSFPPTKLHHAPTPQRSRAYSDDSSINDDSKSTQHRSFLLANLLPLPATRPCPKKASGRFLRPAMNKKQHQKSCDKHHHPTTVSPTTDDDESLGSDIEGVLMEESVTAEESSWGVLGNSGDSSTFPTLGGLTLSKASQSALNSSLSLLGSRYAETYY